MLMDSVEADWLCHGAVPRNFPPGNARRPNRTWDRSVGSHNFNKKELKSIQRKSCKVPKMLQVHMENTARTSDEKYSHLLLPDPEKHYLQNPKPWEQMNQPERDGVQNWFGSMTRPKFQYASTKMVQTRAYTHRRFCPESFFHSKYLECWLACALTKHARKNKVTHLQISESVYAQSRMTSFLPFLQDSASCQIRRIPPGFPNRFGVHAAHKEVPHNNTNTLGGWPGNNFRQQNPEKDEFKRSTPRNATMPDSFPAQLTIVGRFCKANQFLTCKQMTVLSDADAPE